MDQAEINNRFGYHQTSTEQDAAIADVWEMAHEVANTLNELLPDGRDKSLALTKLEEAMLLHAVAAIARNPSS